MIKEIAYKDKEEWLSIRGFEGAYEVSNLGRVRSLERIEAVRTSKISPFKRKRKGKFLKQYVDRYGYMKVVLQNGKPNYFTVHRLVATAFIPNPEGKDSVDHVDCNTKNNCVWNLRWVTNKENLYHSHSLGRQIINATPIVAKNDKGEIFHFPSQREASRHTGLTQSTISRALRGKKIKGWYIEHDSKSNDKK